ncbi:MAG: ATP-binding cassette domain-containing protein [bacterium]
MKHQLEISSAAVGVRYVSYTYPGAVDALFEVSFQVAAGSRTGLIGPNGAGKSTLLLCLLGLLPGFSGAIEVGGTKVLPDHDLTELRRRAGLVFQDPDDQLFNPTVLEDVAFGPLNLGFSQKESETRARESLSRVGVSQELFDRPPHRLSRGQKRRVAIAGVLAMEPSLLLLDEPTSDLDPRGRRELANLLADLPTTMIIASHDLEFVLESCDQVVVMDAGKTVARGLPPKIMSDRDCMHEHGLEVPHSLTAHSVPHHES